MLSSPLEFKGISEGSDMRFFLKGAEVWRGLTFLGVVSIDWFAAQMQERLDLLTNLEQLRAELAASPTRHLGPPVDDTRPYLRKPLAFMPITSETKTKRRGRRQKNKGRRAAAP